MAIQKYHIYRIFKSDGTYLGTLDKDNVLSDFSYNQIINSNGVQIQIELAISPDNAGNSLDPIRDELGSIITDENNNAIYPDSQPLVIGVGTNNGNVLVSNNNLVKVYEVSSYHPNGVIVFDGYISKWKPTFGSPDTVTVTCLNSGQDFGQNVIPGGTALIVDQSQTNHSDDGFFDSFAGQNIVIGSGVTNIAAVNVRIGSTVTRTLTLSLLSSFLIHHQAYPASQTVIATATANIVPVADYVLVQFVFATPITVTPGAALSFTITDNVTPVGSDNDWQLEVDDSGQSYTPGQSFLAGLASGIPIWTDVGNSFYFQTFRSTGTTERLYVNRDVAYILNDIMANYFGAVSYTPIANTGVVVPIYTFKVNTMLEGIQAVQALGPSNYYWFIDPATNILYYQASNTVADVILLKGRHINEIDIEATKENIFNVVYFTGGDDGSGTSTNIFVKRTNSNSLITDRLGIARITNTNVTGTTGYLTAQILADNYIAEHNAETYITNVTIEDGTMDTSIFKVGLMVGFSGNGNFMDNLLLQIVSVNKASDQTSLQLGTLPIRASGLVEQINSQLTSTQTVANPDIPS